MYINRYIYINIHINIYIFNIYIYTNPQSLEVIVCSWATDSFMLGKRDS